MPRKTTVRGAYLAYGCQEWAHGFRYYQYQEEVVSSDAPVVIIDAPTGSGKTLAALARILQHGQSALFLYPTNSLVQDQVQGIKKSLEKMGHRPRMIGGKSTDIVPDVGDTTVDLIHMTGATLEHLNAKSKRSKGGVIDKVLTATQDSGRVRLLLTNPDTLYLAFAGWYARHGRISEQVQRFNTIVLDEFHLYAGPILAKVFFIVNHLRGSVAPGESKDLMFLSATHGDTLQLLTGTYPTAGLVSAATLDSPDQSAGSRKIRHATACEVWTQNDILYSTREAEKVAGQIVQMYQMDYPREGEAAHVKVLGVFSSVVFASRVAQEVRRQLEAEGIDPACVYEVHGLVPQAKRPDIERLREAILVGTSAIEVGVDFDVPFLVMEAHDLASFLQRFGRGGRHRECKAILYVPQPAADRFAASNEWPYTDFVSAAAQGFKSMPAYAGYLCSSTARRVLSSLATAGARESTRLGDHRRVFDRDAAAGLFQMLFEDNSTVALGDCRLKDNIGSLDEKDIASELKRRVTRVLAMHGYLRGTMNSMPVYVGAGVVSDGHGFYTELDIIELARLRGHLEDIAQHEGQMPQTIRNRHRGKGHVFVIDSLERVGSLPRIRLDRSLLGRRRCFVYDSSRMSMKTGDRRMDNIMDSILHERNIVFYDAELVVKSDYRIPRVYVEGGRGAVVIGEWALVVEYMYHKMRGGSTP